MSDLKLIIGNKNYSSWSLRPWMLLRHLGLDFEEYQLTLDTPQFARDIANWSPSLRVPALHHGELVIWDSLAICEYAGELAGRGVQLPERAMLLERAVHIESRYGTWGLPARKWLRMLRPLGVADVKLPASPHATEIEPSPPP